MNKIILYGVLLVLLSTFVAADNCGGTVECHCGDTLNESHTMWYGLNNCQSYGLIIGADDITLNCNGHLIDGDNQGVSDYGIYLFQKNNVSILNCDIREFYFGTYVDQSTNNNIANNNIHDNYHTGISTYTNSNNNNITENNVFNNPNGIYFAYSQNDSVSENVVSNNGYGMYVWTSNNIQTWANSFKNNDINAWENVDSVHNSWNESDMGNFWSDFINNSGYPNYYEIPGDGDGIDWHPLNALNQTNTTIMCGDTITENTVLVNDLLNCPENGVVIGANDITLDCNGHLIDGVGITEGEGVYLHSKNNVTVKNCNITQFLHGIYVYDNSNDNNIMDNLLDYNDVGVLLDEHADNNNVFGNEMTNDIASGMSGIYLSNSFDNNIHDNTIEGSEGGIFLAYYSSDNFCWGNSLIGNNLNSHEEATTQNNAWNYTTVGNFWSDFESNPGYPNYYEIQGPGSGIDWHPLNAVNQTNTTIQCGDTITQNTVLTNDLLNCEDDGLIIEADGITLDCDGHMINGSGTWVSDYYGVKYFSKNDITIKNCRIQEFEAGIFMGGSPGSTHNNVNNNILADNQFGVALSSDSMYNLLWNNTFENNNVNGYEGAEANDNYWNNSVVGNYWSDFAANPGYPSYYVIRNWTQNITSYDGLSHYWKLDESSGDASDQISNGWTLANTNVAYVPAKINNGADIIANYNTAKLEKLNLDYNESATMTYEFWLKFDQDYNNVMSYYKDSDNYLTVGVWNPGGGNRRMWIDHKVDGNRYYTYGDTTLSPGTWYHLAYVLNHNTQTVTFYLNGVLETHANYVGTFSASTISGATEFTLGGGTWAPNGDFLVDDVRIWNVGRSQAEILANMDGLLPVQENHASIDWHPVGQLTIPDVWIDLVEGDINFTFIGGILNYTIIAGNNEQYPVDVDIWVDVTLPNGRTYGPVLGPVFDFNIPAGLYGSRDRSLFIPPSAPPGYYYVNSYLGDYSQTNPTIYAEDHFMFVKQVDTDNKNVKSRDVLIDTGQELTGIWSASKEAN